MKGLVAIFVFTLLISAASPGQNVAECPKVEVVGPADLVMAGQTMVFRAKVSGISAGKITSFDWQISSGTITDGQGTDQIRVVSMEGDPNLTATVTIKGPAESCVTSATEVYAVAPNEGCMSPIDEYGDSPWEDEQVRLDNLLFQIRDNPKTYAFVEMSILPKDTVENTKKHIIKMLKHVRKRDRDFDLGRLMFAVRRAREHRTTTFWIFPEAAAHPECADDCSLINGKHLFL